MDPLGIPRPHHDALLTARRGVTLLLDPPSTAFHHPHSPNSYPGSVRISLCWVINAIGPSHFMRRVDNGRPVLKDYSVIKMHGRAAGLPNGYYLWLVGECKEPRDGARLEAFHEYWMSEGQLMEAREEVRLLIM